jgi:Caspase domain
MSCRWWTALLLVPAIATAAAPAETPGKRWWGVVVGVGQYEHLDASLALDGPPNDVPLMVTWLRRQGVPREHLTVLADQVAHADGLPTRAAILRALQALPDKMAPGDIAFLYFAGHGSQQPQGGTQWSKTDGLDEIFLPRDVGGWDAASGRVAGAIVGHEIGQTVEALRSRGIFVWMVFDSCHSATIARSLMIPHVRSRGLAPAQLGVPRSTVAGVRPADSNAGQLVKLQGNALAGGYVAFYAAQTVDTAPEMPLPPGEPRSQVHGLFTYALLRSLATTGTGSYREVAHRILAFYASTYPTTTPEFEGALDGAIGAPGAPLLNPDAWPAQHSGPGFRIDSGRLSGLTPLSLLALYAAVPGSRNAAPLGLLRVSRVTLSDAWADPVDDPKELKTWKVPVDRSAEVATGVVRVLRTSVDTAVRVAGPATCFASLPAPYGCQSPNTQTSSNAMAVELARRITSKAGCLPPGAEFTSDIDAADLFLLVREHRLFVAQSATRSLNLAVGVDLDSPNASADLQQVLFRANRSVALLRLAADFPEKPGELIAEVRTRETLGRWRPIGDLGAAPVALGAELVLQLQNTGALDLDVTVLAIDDHFGITAVYPVDQESNLLRHSSARIEISGWARTPGENQLVLITEKARAGRAHDLGYLAQPGVARHAAGTGLAALLENIGFSARGTRSSLSEDDQRESSIKVLRYEVSNGL